MGTPPGDEALAALLEDQLAERERLIQDSVLADAEDGVAEARCADLLAEFGSSANRFALRAGDLAVLARTGGSPEAVAAATLALGTARVDVMRAHLRVVQEWAVISQARLDRVRDLSQRVAKVCTVTSVLADRDRPHSDGDGREEPPRDEPPEEVGDIVR